MRISYFLISPFWQPIIRLNMFSLIKAVFLYFLPYTNKYDLSLFIIFMSTSTSVLLYSWTSYMELKKLFYFFYI